jgi:uncharacterized alpha/beta hydrolase family protein
MKKIILVLVVIAVAVGAIGFYLWNKPSEYVSDGKPDFIISLTELTNDGKNLTDSIFGTKYVGKAMQFEAEVESVADNKGAKTLTLKTNDDGLVVNAGFHESIANKLSKIVAGDKVKLQCDCSGVTKPESEDDLLSEIEINLTRCNLIK